MTAEITLYKEYYEYDEYRNPSRVANNKGELTDYQYLSNGLLDYSIDYDFKWGTTYTYPYDAPDPDALITKTPKTKTDYTYNKYGLCTKYESFQVDINGQKIEGATRKYHDYSYNISPNSKIFGSLQRENDELYIDIYYYYDQTDGKLLATVNLDSNTGICYTYDEMDNLTGVMPATFSSPSSYTPVTNRENVEYTYNSNNYLESIQTNSTTYTFNYDIFGNNTSIDIGNSEIVEYVYNQNNGKLKKTVYSNGFSVEYVYNDIELLTELWYTDDVGTKQKAYEYEYTADGQLYKFTDNLSDKSTVYRYDSNNRLVGFVEYENDDLIHDFSSEVFYNDKGLLSGTYYDLNFLNGSATDSAAWSYSYTYHPDDKIEYIFIRNSESIGGEYFYYDWYDRVNKKVYTFEASDSSSSSFRYEVNYTFEEYSGNSSDRIATYTGTVNPSPIHILTTTTEI